MKTDPWKQGFKALLTAAAMNKSYIKAERRVGLHKKTWHKTVEEECHRLGKSHRELNRILSNRKRKRAGMIAALYLIKITTTATAKKLCGLAVLHRTLSRWSTNKLSTTGNGKIVNYKKQQFKWKTEVKWRQSISPEIYWSKLFTVERINWHTNWPTNNLKNSV